MKLTPEEKLARKREYHRRWKKTPQGKACRKRYQQTEKFKAWARAKRRRYYNANIESVRQYSRKWYKSHPTYSTEYNIRRNEAVAGRPRPSCCEVCGNDRETVFDHCHQRGIFRGWLCHNCNLALGLVHDDLNHLRKLIAYLERTKDTVSPQLSLPGV